jgi:hypothetical protein
LELMLLVQEIKDLRCQNKIKNRVETRIWREKKLFQLME